MSKVICYYLLFVFIIQVIRATKESSPVFLLDDNHVLSDIKFTANPFDKLHMNEFELIVQKALTKAAKILIFVERKLSTEDITARDSKGTPFQKLQSALKLGDAKYHPAVETPYQTLKSLIRQTKSNTYTMERLSQTNNPDWINKTMKSLYVEFSDDSNEDQFESLRRHDRQITELFKYIQRVSLGNVVAFYTGRTNQIHAKPPTFSPKVSHQKKPKSKLPQPTKIVASGALYRLEGVTKLPKSKPSRYTVYEGMLRTPSETLSATDLTSKLTFEDFHLQFNFGFTPYAWRLASVSLIQEGVEVGRSRLDISVPWNFSYVCNDPITIHNSRDGSTVSVTGYQIEPMYEAYEAASLSGRLDPRPIHLVLTSKSATPKAKGKFSPPEHCGPFFTGPILSGVVVVATMLMIFSGGLIAMFDLRTNNKFDDANSTKRLTIIEN